MAIALQMPESLECPLCLEAFKAPTLLFCGHTFCKVCLDQYDEQHRGQDFMECPVCKKRTKLEKNRVAGLAPNFSLKGLEEELQVPLKVNGISSEYCSMHSQVYKDIFCEVCKEFICLTCLFDKHQGHRFRKKEALGPFLKKHRMSLSKKSEKVKAEIKVSITNAKQHMHDMHSRLERQILNSFLCKINILVEHKERLSKENDDIRKNSGKVLTDIIKRQEHSLQLIDEKSTLIGQEGIASTSTCTFSDSDALKTLYIGVLGLQNELARDRNDLLSIADALREVGNTRFCPSDVNNLDLGTLDQEASESENESDQASLDQDASESEDDLDEKVLHN